MKNHVEIKTNDTSGEITINGISVSDIVRKYTITHEAGKPPVIEVELVGDVTVSGGFITPLPEPWKSIYHNLSKGGNDEPNLLVYKASEGSKGHRRSRRAT